MKKEQKNEIKLDLKNGINQLRLLSLSRGLKEKDIINTLEEVIKEYIFNEFFIK